MDGLLAGYAAGTLPRPFHVLVSAHLEINPANRPFVRHLEAAKGEALMDQQPCALAQPEAMLSAILGQAPDKAAPRPLAQGSGASVLPPSLRAFVGGDVADLRWQFRLPGVREHRIATENGVSASLLWVRAGRAMPQHRHAGLEATLLLQGGFSDIDGHFRRGDIAIGEDETEHQPIADADEDCLCFAVTEGHSKLTGSLRQILRSLIGRTSP